MEKLSYGMKLRLSVHPIQYAVGFIGVTSSDVTMKADFVVSKFWEDDTDPMSYKVKLIPIDKSGKFGNENFYSSDLVRIINDGRAELLSE